MIGILECVCRRQGGAAGGAVADHDVFLVEAAAIANRIADRAEGLIAVHHSSERVGLLPSFN